VGTILHQPAPGVVEVYGALCFPFAAQVHQCLLDAVTTGDDRLILDLAHATTLDCAGVGTLIGARNAARTLGKPFHLINARAQVANVLGLLGLLNHSAG
jgi:anti-anti-sigma factor